MGSFLLLILILLFNPSFFGGFINFGPFTIHLGGFWEIPYWVN